MQLRIVYKEKSHILRCNHFSPLYLCISPIPKPPYPILKKKGDLVFITHNLLRHLQQPLSLQILHNLHDALLHTLLITPNVNLRGFRRLVWRTHARKLWNLALARLLVQALGVTRFSDFKRDVDVDFDESEGRLGSVRGGGVQGASLLAIGLVRGNEGCNGDCGGVGEELCYLLYCVSFLLPSIQSFL